ncbi:branched-chain amino acid ABC transporter permease [Deinococcus irradiatisoli]|uniref:Branched-chain amino acid ABC transporter permease n=1 Tax=Deinococcus irradiatisoli TaxID=2202254 RepID=A0A2Z3JI45_9DEIO|nr:branched-chain amino acid ABC transporter permease [Deinococcus irradiatisoli]AWN23676.1 branched-chain amino acid ABC transporter permease [Deinococcus irradiatisoli]
MTAVRPGSQPPTRAPDRSLSLIVLAIISSALLLISQERSWLAALPSFIGNILKNPLVASLVLTLFLANLLFAYRWNAQLWAKLLVGGLSLFLILPWAGRDNTSVFDLAIQIGIFAALSLGLNIVVGLAGLLDLGYIAFFAVGAYTWGIFGSGQIGKVMTYFKENGSNGPLTLIIGLALLIATALSLRAINRVKGKRTPAANWGFLLAALGLVIGVILTVRGAVILASAGTALGSGVNPNFFWLFLILAVAAAASVGVLIGLPVLKLKGDYLAIITLGLGEVIRVLANNLSIYSNGSQGITPIGSASVPWLDSLAGGLGFSPDQYNLFFLYFLVLVIIAVIILVNMRLDRSRIGRAWIAIREDEIAAQAMGIPLVQTKLIAFATGASFAGIMGVIFAAKQTFISPESFILTQSISVLSMVVLGGLGSIPGVILGAAVVTILNISLLPSLGEATANLNLPQQVNPAQLQRLVFGGILVAMMLFRPEGLLPSVRQRRMMHEDDDVAGNLTPQDSIAGELNPENAAEVYSPGIATRADNERGGGTQ